MASVVFNLSSQGCPLYNKPQKAPKERYASNLLHCPLVLLLPFLDIRVENVSLLKAAL